MEAFVWKVIESVFTKLAHLVEMAWGRRKRPKLVIEPLGDRGVLEVRERQTIYGCSIRNVGRLPAADVRVQLLKIEARGQNGKYRTLLEHTYDLAPTASASDRTAPIILVPGGKKDFRLASSQDSGLAYSAYDGIVFPSVSELPEQFDELAFGVDEYLYTVAAFDHPGPVVTRAIRIRL